MVGSYYYLSVERPLLLGHFLCTINCAKYSEAQSFKIYRRDQRFSTRDDFNSPLPPRGCVAVSEDLSALGLGAVFLQGVKTTGTVKYPAVNQTAPEREN